jgi:hypothetical protein
MKRKKKKREIQKEEEIPQIEKNSQVEGYISKGLRIES